MENVLLFSPAMFEKGRMTYGRSNMGFAAVFLVCILCGQMGARAASEASWWGNPVESCLVDAGTNRVEIENALLEIPIPRREGMAFLVENMPVADLRSLSAAFLLENATLAYQAWEESAWHRSVPTELFLNDVLPYACMNERRDPWRARLREVGGPIVAGCTNPGQAALLLNATIFPLLKVRYSTARLRTNQSPDETIKTRVATCTSLSILLVDACRSVGIPARVAGTPMWSNMRGNHTWVEIWDGAWHFMGAAEPDPAGLDRAWFVHDASQAQRDVPRHAIYATSFRRTKTYFPLVWSPRDESVSAVNVTDRYASRSPLPDDRSVRLAVKVVQPSGERVVAELTVSDTADPGKVLQGKSRGETADLNDLAIFNLIPGRKYRIRAWVGTLTAESDVTPTETAAQLVTLRLAPKPPASSRHTAKGLPKSDSVALKDVFTGYFTADPGRQAAWKFAAGLEALLNENEPTVRQIAWEAYRAAPIHTNLHADFEAHIVNSRGYRSPYTVKEVGKRPANGWAMFIAMHGGGGAPKRVNDQQWEQMQIYYRDHPEQGGYLYLSLRAPNDEWNGFYADYVYPLIDELIRQFRLFGDIDPDKVFIMGYSHGGYGAYAIGPKMPDRFAAIHASAAAATDGETTPKTLRTTPFTAMVGERDTMFGRYTRNVAFKQEIEKLRGERTDIYPVTVTIIPGNRHTGLPDRDKIADLYPAVRNPVPRELDWLMTDGVVQDFFWLRVSQPGKQQEIVASCQSNRFALTTTGNVSGATMFMDTRLVDFSRPVEIELNGSTVMRRFAPNLKTLCETLMRRADPGYAFTAEFTITKDGNSDRLIVAPSASKEMSQ
jgi:transglutaminase-like putative cysteine protease